MKISITVLVLTVALAGGCSRSNGSGDAQASSAAAPAPADSAAQSAATGAPDASTDPAASPADSNAASSGGSCSLVTADQVQQAIRLPVKSVVVTSNGCTFHFGGYHGDIDITYAAQGGHDEIDAARKAGAGVKAIMGGIAGAASAPPEAMGMISATPPPDVAKVGEDQEFVSEGPVTQFYATKGDAYVEVEGGFFPEGTSRWVALPQIAQAVFATH